MSRHGFTDLSASLRNGGQLTQILEAIQSGHIGEGRPDYAVPGMVWADQIDADTIKLMLHVGGSPAADVAIGTADLVAGKFSANAIGIGQTWQDVSGSRSAGTSYQNTTGKPIVVCTQARDDASPPFEVSTNNSTWVTLATLQDNTGSNQQTNIWATVPDQHYYRLGSPASISVWAELR
jgi:hypothetical protein